MARGRDGSHDEMAGYLLVSLHHKIILPNQWRQKALLRPSLSSRKALPAPIEKQASHSVNATSKAGAKDPAGGRSAGFIVGKKSSVLKRSVGT